MSWSNHGITGKNKENGTADTALMDNNSIVNNLDDNNK